MPRNPHNLEEKRLAVETAIRHANAFLNGRIGAIETARALSRCRHDFGPEFEALFLTFVGVDSETDDLPLGDVRTLWNKDALASADIEISNAENLYRDHVADACRKLVQALKLAT